MSQAPNTGRVLLSAKIGEAVAAVGSMTDGLAAVMRVRLYDLLSHHRLGVMKRQLFPAGRGAQKMIASRTFRYTKRTEGDSKPLSIMAESFAAAESGLTFGANFFENVEGGATINAGGYFVIPAGKGARRTAKGIIPNARFRELLAAGAFFLGKNGRLFLKSVDMASKRRPELWGVLRKVRKQRPLLRWYSEFDSIAAQHAVEIDRDITAALGVIDVETREEGRRESSIVGALAKSAYERTLAKYLAANPSAKPALARRIARNAARTARLLAGGGKYGSQNAVNKEGK